MVKALAYNLSTTHTIFGPPAAPHLRTAQHIAVPPWAQAAPVPTSSRRKVPHCKVVPGPHPQHTVPPSPTPAQGLADHLWDPQKLSGGGQPLADVPTPAAAADGYKDPGRAGTAPAAAVVAADVSVVAVGDGS